MNTLYQGDNLPILCNMPDASVDLICTDPPFGIDFDGNPSNYNRDNSYVIKEYSEVNHTDYLSFTMAWLSEATRVLKQSGSMYIFSGWNNLKDLLIAIDACHLTTINHLIWKYQFGVVTTRKYVTSHYHCLYVCKDDKKRKFFPYSRYGKSEKTDTGGSSHYRDKEDVWVINREYWRGKPKTPTKMPLELANKILSYSTEKGDIVLDPFAGSGTTLDAAHTLGRHWIGIDIGDEAINVIQSRLRDRHGLEYDRDYELSTH